jgi:hypothetical protein
VKACLVQRSNKDNKRNENLNAALVNLLQAERRPPIADHWELIAFFKKTCQTLAYLSDYL